MWCCCEKKSVTKTKKHLKTHTRKLRTDTFEVSIVFRIKHWSIVDHCKYVVHFIMFQWLVSIKSWLMSYHLESQTQCKQELLRGFLLKCIHPVVTRNVVRWLMLLPWAVRSITWWQKAPDATIRTIYDCEFQCYLSHLPFALWLIVFYY